MSSCNNARTGLYAFLPAVRAHKLDRLFDINVIAPLALAQTVTGVSLPWAPAYSASKFALSALRDALRRELKQDRIHVLEVCSRIVSTEFRNHVLAGSVPPSVARIAWTVLPDLVAVRNHQEIEARRNGMHVPRIGRLLTAFGRDCARAYGFIFFPLPATSPIKQRAILNGNTADDVRRVVGRMTSTRRRTY